MYKITVNSSSYTIPKQNIRMLALHEALERRYIGGAIKDDTAAIRYLETIGMKVEEV